MSNAPIQLPIDEDARARLSHRRPGRRRRLNDQVVQPEPFSSATWTERRFAERRRTMPDFFVFWAIIFVVVLNVTPLAVLFLIGY